MKKLLSPEVLAKEALIAALYFVLTVTLGSAAFLNIQFRYSEFLNLLAFYNPVHAIGITLGVFLSNLFSPLGLADVVFGTLHTVISLIFITKSKNLFVASLWPTVFSFIIGFELSVIAGIPGGFLVHTFSVMVSEFIIMSIISVFLYRLLEKNQQFTRIIEADPEKIGSLG